MTEEKQPSESAPPEPRTAEYASDEEPIVLRPHVYDGIQEYDQKLPNWWLFTFYIMVVFFVFFWIAYYQLDFFKSDEERINAVMSEVETRKQEELEQLLDKLDDRTLVTEWARNEAALANAQENYTTLCMACHAPDLSATVKIEGADPIPLPGLSLIDGEWKYGGNPMDIFKLIREGTPPDSPGHNNARMEPWGDKISSQAIAELTAFIISKNEAEFARFTQ